MPFAALGLAPELVRAVKDEGYMEPTPVQREAIPLALDGRDLIGSAQTGTGKTAAFLLPILQRIEVNGGHRLRALVLVPTRELAEQVYASAKTYGRFSRLRSTPVYGGVGLEPQRRAIKSGVDLVIATPGRLLDHLRRGNVDLSGIEVLVLDKDFDPATASFQTVGTLLVFGLLVGPPATAALIVRRVPAMMAVAALIGALSVVVGLAISYHADTSGSATMAVTPIALFFLALTARSIRTRAALATG